MPNLVKLKEHTGNFDKVGLALFIVLHRAIDISYTFQISSILIVSRAKMNTIVLLCYLKSPDPLARGLVHLVEKIVATTA